MRRFAALGAALIVAAGIAVADSPTPDPSPERIAQLIQQLGSSRFAQRESASRALDAIGEPALDALQAATLSTDAEIRGRAGDILKRINQRTFVTRTLKPTMVSLDFERTPISKAVQILARSTGLTIELPTPGLYDGRTVSIKSPPLPAWEALELFCRKADLHESDPTPQNGVVQTDGNVILGGAFQGQIIINGPGAIQPARAPSNKVVLQDGPGAVVATHHAGAVRLRLMPAGTPFPMNASNDVEHLPLAVSAEPRLQWAGALGVRIEKMIDDRGLRTSATGVVAPFTEANNVVFVQLANGAMMAQPATTRTGLAAIRINRPDKVVRSFREVSGELTGQIHAIESLARLDGPLMADTTAAGIDGVSMKLVDVATPKADELTLAIELKYPPDVQPSGAIGVAGKPGPRVVAQGGLVFQQQQVVFNGNKTAPVLPAGTTEFNGLVVEDARGQRWTATTGGTESMTISPQGIAVKLNVTFKAPAAAAAAAPARLVFRGSRPVMIAIPFSFRDVPLP